MTNPVDSTNSGDLGNDLSWLRGQRVLVAGGRVSGQATIEPLVVLGAVVTVADSTLDFADRCAELGADTVTTASIEADQNSIKQYALVVTSPGFRPDAPILAAAAGHGIPIWGDVELSWRVDHCGLYGPPRKWLVVTGTNGKTTTTSMLASILDAAGLEGRACGNIGLPVLEALMDTSPRVDYLAVELSSFQLHWAPSVCPDAGVVLNVAEDHLDWHGGMAAYAEAKARALSGKVAVVGLDDAIAAQLGRAASADVVVGFRLGAPVDGELGVADGFLVDNAFGTGVQLAEAADIDPPGPAGIMDALAAAALARAVGIAADAVRAGLAAHQVGPHRGAVVGTVGSVVFVDDSKATNPHAARPSILAHERVVWIAGGLLKGASVDELVAEVGSRLAGAVLLGSDAGEIEQALSRHAPEVPVVRVGTEDDAQVNKIHSSSTKFVTLPSGSDADAVMAAVVGEAAELALVSVLPGSAVVLAPAAASLDMFDSYGHRGNSFAAAVAALSDPPPGSVSEAGNAQ
ncbi:UDP-N-acetylmuramoyl-L-alanine--D-glutamate ligase [Rhodococcus sp. IEGM 1379]|uniref:UDP-N-acetylmuramoyl-L-alanine--D-glutamate ligase n=1 Tax=Rhodococcus sp. IEGM 1379 TaxID=3047086 RepID=UPI0024B771BB|nr:UDP-N-acetylmuramoyl-L-alanine--D-glutamate ligase [Rhodococcus sp. IEGM 1379]MDI9914287.1 UDP-N-acetylmuramoyl-L-alanine--D-glutamate ligase [Rhodococcus sp. IEGM 1379]